MYTNIFENIRTGQTLGVRKTDPSSYLSDEEKNS